MSATEPVEKSYVKEHLRSKPCGSNGNEQSEEERKEFDKRHGRLPGRSDSS